MKKWDGFDENNPEHWVQLGQLRFVMDYFKNLIFVSVISADNDEFGLSEDDKQEIMRRSKLDMGWDYVFEPIEDEKKRRMLIELFEESDVD